MKLLGVSLMILDHLALTYRVETGLEDILVSVVILTNHIVIPGIIVGLALKTAWGLLGRRALLVS